MKKNCLLFIVLMLVSFFAPPLNAQAQLRPVKTGDTSGKVYHPIFYQLTEQDKRDYVLTTGEPRLITRDTAIKKFAPGSFRIYQQKVEVLGISITLSNRSKDTLQYIGMSCSWWDSYETDDPKISIIQPNTFCYKNNSTVISIAPYSSSTVTLNVAVPKELGKTAEFKMGMILQKYVDKSVNLEFSRFQPGNVIWSDEIQFP